MNNVVVFDLGGTLMEYEGMPLSWIPYYEAGMAAVNQNLGLELSQEELEDAVRVLKEYNPRFRPREVEYPPEQIFSDAMIRWSRKADLQQVVEEFFRGIKLVPRIYEDTLPGLHSLRKRGYKLACLTNLPSAMPDSLFRRGISQLVDALDLYVSSETCGFRKPNRAGLDQIAEYFQVPVQSLLFVGDEEIDAQTAKNAGCSFVWMNRRNQDRSWGQKNSVKTLGELLTPGFLGEGP